MYFSQIEDGIMSYNQKKKDGGCDKLHFIKWICLSILLLFFWQVAGCEKILNLSRYETIQVPTERLERIEPLDWQAVSKKDNPTDANEPTAQVPPLEKLNLTIEQCRSAALENNLDITVQLFDPRIAHQDEQETKGYFEPLIFSNFNWSKEDNVVFTDLDANRRESIYNDFGLRIPLHTGGEITLDMPFYRTETDNAFSIGDTLSRDKVKIYGNTLSARINQPLLRFGGIRRNTHALRIAHYGTLVARARTKLEVILVLAAADRAYWRLYAARRELVVRKQEFDLAQAQLQSARRKVAAGEVAEIEIIRAADAAAQRKEAIIIAENSVRDRQRELKMVLNKPELQMETPTVIELQTEPNPQRYVLDRGKLLDYSLTNRMELLELELQIAMDTSTVDYERNGMLPLVNLNYTYNMNGLGDSADDAYDMMLGNRFVNHRLGVAMEIPLGNKSAHSRWRRAQLLRQQRLATKQQRKITIKQEVLNAADQMDSNWQRVIASRQSVLLAERTMKAEQRQFDLGLQISTEVLDAQTRFADAQSAQIQALVEYQIAQVDLAYATGSLLQAAQVHWQPKEITANDSPPK